MEKFHTNNNN